MLRNSIPTSMQMLGGGKHVGPVENDRMFRYCWFAGPLITNVSVSPVPPPLIRRSRAAKDGAAVARTRAQTTPARSHVARMTDSFQGRGRRMWVRMSARVQAVPRVLARLRPET